MAKLGEFLNCFSGKTKIIVWQHIPDIPLLSCRIDQVPISDALFLYEVERVDDFREGHLSIKVRRNGFGAGS